MHVTTRISQIISFCLAFVFSMLFATSSFAQSSENQQIVFEGSLTDNSGNAIDLSSAPLTFYISANGCYLYGETTMTAGDSSGNILHRIGSGTLYPGSPNSFSQNLFFGSVTGTLNFLGSPCSVTASDTRIAQVYYAAQNITASLKIGTVPYAHNATMLNGKSSGDFVQTSADTNTLLFGGSNGQYLTKSVSGLIWLTPTISSAQVTAALGYTPVSQTTIVTAATITSALGYMPAASGSIAANALRGISISSATPTTAQVLAFDGVQWTPTNAMSDSVTNITAGTGLLQAKIVNPNGTPLEAISVNFKFTILDPAGICTLYSESYSAINMTNTRGLISFRLGTGVKTYPVSATTYEQVFSNTTPSLSCDAGGVYSPSSNDIRKIVMQYNDGGGWETHSAVTINAVPYAMFARDSQKLNGKNYTEFVQVASLPTCTASQSLHFNGSSFSCVNTTSISAADVVGALGYSPLNSTANAVTTALGYTPANSSTVTALASSVSTFANATVTSFSTIVSSQWNTSGTAISYSAGNVGIGTDAPRAKLDVSGGTIAGNRAVANSNSAVDFAKGNIQYTTGSCGAFQFHNLKDGAAYTFVVQGGTVATCSFTAFSDSGVTALTVHLPADHGDTVAGKHTIYSLFVAGSHVYFAWLPEM